MTAARTAFGERGYDATSLRSVARAVGVDPALVVHYFGTKQGLFSAALATTIRPLELFGDLGGLPPSERPEAVVRRYLALLDDRSTRDVILGLVRSAVSSERAASMLRDLLAAELVASLGTVIGGDDGALRASLVAAQLIGLAMLRHVVRLDAVASSSTDELVGAVAPVIAGYFA